MEFLHPEFLYYMTLPLLVLFAFLLTQKESVATFFSQEVIERLSVSANILSLKARNILFFIIAMLVVTALAEPVIPEGKIEIKAKSADIMVALDISDSMLAEDLYPNRLKLAKEKILSLLRLAPSERIGVIAFAKNSYMVSPLSFDHDAVSFLVRKLSTDSITEKGTDFLSMLEVVAKNSPKESPKYLLVLSDGGDKSDFSKEIAFAKSNNITLFVLGVATKNGAPIKQKNGEFIKHKGEIIISALNRDIAELATQTGGVFIPSTNATDDIEAMLAEIESQSEKKELKSQEISRYIPLFYFPLGLALLLLLIATSSMSKRRSVELPSAFLIVALLGASPDANAGILDFVELENAKEAYEVGDYDKSAKIYKKYAEKTNNPYGYFNAGNAFYKQKKYKEAVSLYEKAVFENKEYKAKKFANLGNSHAKIGTQNDLEKAKKYYEQSLELVDDSNLRENLEEVIKRIKEIKEQENKQKQEQDEQNQENQENKENQEKQENQESQDQGDEKTENQNEEQKENADKEDANQENQESEQQKSDEESALDEQKREQNDNNESQREEPKESDEEEKSNDENSTKPQMQGVDRSEEMSESEEQKWLQMLGEGAGTYLYRMNENSHKEENLDEKPW